MAGHRERLLEGMTYAAARHGYAGASVARVIERAGVSRATFYEHFVDREDCYLAARRQIVERLRRHVREVARASPPGDRIRAVLEALLRGVAAKPDVARLVLIDALGATASARAEHELLIADLQAAVEGFLAEGGEGAPVLQIPAIALIGGIAGVLSSRVLRGEGPSLPCRIEELLAWAHSYALPAGEVRWTHERWQEVTRGAFRPARPREPAEAPLLPRGRGALPSELVATSRRERIVTETACLVARDGYAALTVDAITAAARVTRSAFYSQFRGKQDAFLAAQAFGLQASIAAAAAEFAVGRSWPDRVWRGLVAMLTYLAEHHDLTTLAVREVPAAGQAALLRDHDYRIAYGLFLSEGYAQRPQAAALPPLCSEAIAGGVHGVIRERVLAGHTERLLEALPQCAVICLAPFIGPAAASELVESRLRSAAPAA